MLEVGLEYKIFFSFALSFASSLIFFPFFIKLIKNKTAPIRDFLSNQHVKDKEKTPALGGILIMVTALFPFLIFADLTNKISFVLIFTALSFGLVGFIDDYLKIAKNNHFTINTRTKLKIQFGLAFLIIIIINLIINTDFNSDVLIIPLFKKILLNIGFLYTILRIFAIMGSVNGVNLTDGLDGLVSFPLILNFTFFAIVGFFFSCHGEILKFKQIFNPLYKEVSIYSACIVGSLLGFLKYNFKPARVFMGDTGSVFLGASLAVVSIILKQEFLLVITGLLFVIETITSFIQIFCIRTGRKRVFKMCPIHHHFEFYNWSEKKIVYLFWLFSFFSFLVGFAIFIKAYIIF